MRQSWSAWSSKSSRGWKSGSDLPQRYFLQILEKWRRHEMKPFIFGRAETVGRSEYLIHLLVSALLYGWFTDLYVNTGKGTVKSIADVVSLMVMTEWIQCAVSRSRNAGLSRWVFALLLVVPALVCGSLVGFSILAWQYTLVLFVLTQIPIGFLPSKHKPVSGNSGSPA